MASSVLLNAGPAPAAISPTAELPVDRLGRPSRALRVSVTDRCNLRCVYCMPEDRYAWLPRAGILSFAEIDFLVERFCEIGVEKVRLTGGEPLLRRDLPDLVRLLSARRLRERSLTTNGILLADLAWPLRAAGLDRVTVSLDTLRRDRFRALTREDRLARVLTGVEAAASAGFSGLKLDTVVLRGVNDDELFDLVDFGKELGAEVRFIEYMEVGGATRWSMDQVVSRSEMLERFRRRFGEVRPLPGRGAATAERFELPGGTTFGIIASTTAPFCRACDRSRLTADGVWYPCLHARVGTDLRRRLRGGATAEELRAVLASRWRDRTDRGAEERLAGGVLTPPVLRAELAADPRLEMHTRGG